MKTITHFLGLFLLCPLWLQGQSGIPRVDPWEFGLAGGVSYYVGDLLEADNLQLSTVNPAYGFFLRNNVSPSFAVRLNALRTDLSGTDANAKTTREMLRGYSFSTYLYEASLQLEWDFLGLRRYDGVSTFNRTISPYLFVGVGAGFTNPEPRFVPSGDALVNERIAIDNRSDINSLICVPFGLGLKADLARRFTLALELSARPTFYDYLDGISLAADPTTDDWYFLGTMSLAYRFPYRAKSPKPVNNTKPSMVADRDEDGFADVVDRCPDVPGTLRGCPDADGDGVRDEDDNCPSVAGIRIFNGCPDTDGDGIKDDEDACPDIAGIVEKKGCPRLDADGDGVDDDMDDCPNEPGIPLNRGCPAAMPADMDGDGVPNQEDACPGIPGSKAFNGCPDTDGDGVMDLEDKCPVTPGAASNRGCPEVTDDTREVLRFVTQNILFEFNSSTLTEASKTTLDRVVEIMKEYPDYSMHISGFTDATGDEIVNQYVSEARANACKLYLINKGVPAKRLNARGFGETAPIASNQTTAGRQQNRRVEFSLYLPR